MSLVPGIAYTFYLFDNGIWKPYACARSADFSLVTEFLETTVTGSGNWKTFKPTVHSFSQTIDGIISLNVSANLSLPELHGLQIAKTKILTRIILTSVAGDVYTREAYCYIESATDTGSFDGIATFRISFKGTGAITQIFTPPSPTTGQVKRYPPAGSVASPAMANGESAWTMTGMANKVPLNVVRDGRGSSDIILSGTPVGNEVLYETVGIDGLLTWAFPYEDIETKPYMEYNDQ